MKKNKTVIRLISFMMMLMLLVSFLLPPVEAEAGILKKYDFKTISVHTVDNLDSEPYYAEVISMENGDLMISVEDLKKFSGMKVENKKNTIIFTRGLKSVYIDTKKNQLSFDTSKTEMINAPIEYKGSYYLSGASVLPYLNVCVLSSEGKLYVIRDEVSIWDYIEEFDEDFVNVQCDYGTVLAQCGYGKGSKILGYLESEGLFGWIEHCIYIPGVPYSYGTDRDYYAAYAEMLQDVSPVETVLKDLTKNGKKIAALTKILEKADSTAGYNDAMSVMYGAIGITKGVKMSLKYYKICYALQNDLSGKMAWLYELFANSYNYSKDNPYTSYTFPPVVPGAAQSIYTDYSYKYQAILTQIMDDMADWAIDEITGDILKNVSKLISVYSAFDETEVSSTCNCNIYDTIADSVVFPYKENRLYLENADFLDNCRAFACLNLFFNAKNWEILSKYAKKAGRTDIADQCTKKQELCLNWIAFWEESAEATENDTYRYKNGTKKEVYEEELLSAFDSLSESNGKNATESEEKQNDVKKNSGGEEFFAFFPDGRNNDESQSSKVTNGIYCEYMDSGDTIVYAFNHEKRHGTFVMYPDTLEEKVELIRETGSYRFVNKEDRNRQFELTLSDNSYCFSAIFPQSQGGYDFYIGRNFGGAVVYGENVFFIDENGCLCKYTYEYGKEMWEGSSEVILDGAGLNDWYNESYVIERANRNGTFVVVKQTRGNNPEYILFDSTGKKVRESNEMEAYAEPVRKDGSLAIVDISRGNGVHDSGYVDANGVFSEDEWVRYITNDCDDYYIDITYSDGDIYYVTYDNELYVRKSGTNQDTLIYKSKGNDSGILVHPFDGVLFVTPEYAYVYNGSNSGAAYKISLNTGNGEESVEVTKQLFPTKSEKKQEAEEDSENKTGNEWMNGIWVSTADSSHYLEFDPPFEYFDVIYYNFKNHSTYGTSSSSFIIQDGNVMVSTMDGYMIVDVYYNPYTEELTINGSEYGDGGLDPGKTTYVRK